jgi:hypothetical protein
VFLSEGNPSPKHFEPGASQNPFGQTPNSAPDPKKPALWRGGLLLGLWPDFAPDFAHLAGKVFFNNLTPHCPAFAGLVWAFLEPRQLSAPLADEGIETK